MVKPDKRPTALEINTAVQGMEVVLGSFEAAHAVDGRLIDAFRAGSMYCLGGEVDTDVDPKNEVLIVNLKLDSLAYAQDSISHVAPGTFRPKGVDKESRALRRDLDQWSVNDWIDSASPEWVGNMARTEGAGLDRSSLLSYLRGWLEIYYKIPGQQRIDPAPQPSGIFGKLLLRVVNHDRITAADFPQGDLDARITNFLDLTQFEMAAIFMADTFNLGCMGKQGRQAARQLARMHTPTVFDYDIDHKRVMMLDVAARFEQLKSHVRGDNREVLDILASRSRNVTSSLDDAVAFFRTVYRNLGYTLPDILREPEQQVEPVLVVAAGSAALTEAAEPETVVVVDEIEVAAIDPALVAEMASRSEALAENIRSFASRWTLSNKQHKPYAELTRQLSLGFVNDAGRQLSPIPNAREIVDAIVHLARMSQDRKGPVAAAERLAQTIERQRELQAAGRELRRWGSENSVPYNGAHFPSVHDVESLIRMIRSDWIHCAQAIRRHWPRDQVAGVAEHIEHLFTAYDQRTASARSDEP